MKRKIIGSIVLMSTLAVIGNAESLEERISNLEKQLSKSKESSGLFSNDFEFHGYARVGAFLNKNGKSTGPVRLDGHNNNRLGNESESYWEAELVKGIDIGKDSWAKFHLMFAGWSNGDYSTYGDEKVQVTPNIFVEMGNVLGDGTVAWVGKRFNAREDIHITDFYYRNFSGTGFGVEGIKIGDGKLDTSFVLRDDDVKDATGTVTDNTESVFTLHNQYATGKWNFELAIKSDSNSGTDVADLGIELGVDYSLPGFYGQDTGWSKIITQFGTGLSSGGGLGNTYTNTNRDDAFSARIITTGQANFNGFQIMPEFVYQHDMNYNGTKDAEQDWISIGARQVIPINKHFEWQLAGTYDHISQNNKAGGKNGGLYSLTVAPTLKLDTSDFWNRPELRLTANYNKFTGDYENLSTDKNEFKFGAQAEVWF